MPNELLDQLKAENPLPELLPALPFDVIRDEIDRQPPPPSADRSRSRSRSRTRRRFGYAAAAGLACAVAALVIVAVNSVPSGSAGGFSIAVAQAAIRRGEQRLTAGSTPVLYTQATMISRPIGGRPTSSVDRIWEGNDAWRNSTSNAQEVDGVSDVATVGGVTESYVPATDTVYLNRSGEPFGPAAGVYSDPDPIELTEGATANVAPRGTRLDASSFRGALRQFMALPGVDITRRNGLLTVRAVRGRHSSTVVARLPGDAPVLISTTRPPATFHGLRLDGGTSSWRFAAYQRPLSARAAAGAFDLLRLHPHARVIVTHERHPRLPQPETSGRGLSSRG